MSTMLPLGVGAGVAWMAGRRERNGADTGHGTG